MCDSSVAMDWGVCTLREPNTSDCQEMVDPETAVETQKRAQTAPVPRFKRPANPYGAPPPSAAAQGAMQALNTGEPSQRKHVKTVKYAEEALDGEMRSALAALDLDKNGRVSTTEVLAAAKALREVRGQNQFLRKVAVLVSVTLVAALVSVLGVTVLAVDLGKEMTVVNHALVTPAGSPVQVESADMAVAQNGELRTRSGMLAVKTMGTQSTVRVTLDRSARRLESGGLEDAEVALEVGCEQALLAQEQHAEAVGTAISVELEDGRFLVVTADGHLARGDGSFEMDGFCHAPPCSASPETRWHLVCGSTTERDVEACTCTVRATHIVPRLDLESELSRRLAGAPRRTSFQALADALADKTPEEKADQEQALAQVIADNIADNHFKSSSKCADDGETCECEGDVRYGNEQGWSQAKDVVGQGDFTHQHYKYYVGDMPGQTTTLEDSARDCELRCERTDGCAYFSWLGDTMDSSGGFVDHVCHLHASGAQLRDGHPFLICSGECSVAGRNRFGPSHVQCVSSNFGTSHTPTATCQCRPRYVDAFTSDQRQCSFTEPIVGSIAGHNHECGSKKDMGTCQAWCNRVKECHSVDFRPSSNGQNGFCCLGSAAIGDVVRDVEIENDDDQYYRYSTCQSQRRGCIAVSSGGSWSRGRWVPSSTGAKPLGADSDPCVECMHAESSSFGFKYFTKAQPAKVYAKCKQECQRTKASCTKLCDETDACGAFSFGPLGGAASFRADLELQPIEGRPTGCVMFTLADSHYESEATTYIHDEWSHDYSVFVMSLGLQALCEADSSDPYAHWQYIKSYRKTEDHLDRRLAGTTTELTGRQSDLFV